VNFRYTARMRFLSLFSFCAIFLLGQSTADPWKATEVQTPAQVAAELKSKPVVLYVGFPVLYKGAHLPGAHLAGPGSKDDGLAEIKKTLAGVPHDREVILYCGCCPWEKCPNIRPAYRTIKELGFTNVRVMSVPTNLHTDWVEPGYPTEKGQ